MPLAAFWILIGLILTLGKEEDYWTAWLHYKLDDFPKFKVFFNKSVIYMNLSEGKEFRLRSWSEKSSVNDFRMFTNIQFKFSSRDVVFGFRTQTLVIY